MLRGCGTRAHVVYPCLLHTLTPASRYSVSYSELSLGQLDLRI